jgi:hypothetical protein
VNDDYDDPRTRSSAEGSRRSAVSHAVGLASDAIVPGELHALSRCGDIGVVLATTATDALPPDTLHCNSSSEHRTVESDTHISSAGSFATRSDRAELVHSSVLREAEGAQGSYCPERSSLGLKLPTSIRGDYFNGGIITRPHRPSTLPAPMASTPPPYLLTIHLRPTSQRTIDKLAEISWPLTCGGCTSSVALLFRWRPYFVGFRHFFFISGRSRHKDSP